MNRPAVGIKDVAREAGVSVGTVSNVINRPEQVSEELRMRVQRAVEHLGYVRSETARQLRNGASRMIALLVLDMGNPFFVDLARGAERTARAAGLGMMLCSSNESPDEGTEYLTLFAEQRVRGALVAAVDPGSAGLTLLKRRGIPFVLVDRLEPELDACSVSVDDVAGSEMAVAHLATQGHRAICYVSGPEHLQQIRDRRAGAVRALASAGLPPEALREIRATRLDAAAGRDAAQRLLGLHPRPTAVFCANDLLALGVLQALYAAGVRVPEDVALVGYDDIEFAAAAAIPLSSVRQPAAAMGTQAAEMLLREIADIETDPQPEHRHESVVFQPELVVRASSMSRPGS